MAINYWLLTINEYQLPTTNYQKTMANLKLIRDRIQ